MLESRLHAENAFITLTYDKEHEPKGRTLVPDHATVFIRELRRRLAPKRIRYYLVGEYGDEHDRPHYHLVVFGLWTCLRGRTDQLLHNNSKKRWRCCKNCTYIQSLWEYGSIDLGQLNTESAQYISGYVTKKLTSKNDPYVLEKLNGRHPEFARRSNRPGIGAGYAPNIVESLTSEHGHYAIEENMDVPFALNHGRRKFPLGRYMREKVRLAYGFAEKGAPKETLQEVQKEMCRVYEEKREIAISEGKTMVEFHRELKEQDEQKIRNKERKFKIYKQKGSL